MGFNARDAKVSSQFSWEVEQQNEKETAGTGSKVLDEIESVYLQAQGYNDGKYPQLLETSRQHGGSGGNLPPGGSDGGSGGDDGFPLKREDLGKYGFDRDMANLYGNNATLRATYTAILNAREEAKYKERWKQTYQSDSIAVTGAANPNPDTDMPLVRFHDDPSDPGGRWQASLQELQRSLELRFSAGAYHSSGIAVQRFLSMPGIPTHSSEARTQPGVYTVEISFTDRGHQQAQIEQFRQHVTYSNNQEIDIWLKNLELKI